MAFPLPTVRIDWADKGDFTGAYDTVNPRGEVPIKTSRGASADFGSEMSGRLTFSLDNPDDRYTPDRNWMDNPSFEVSTKGWEIGTIGTFTAPATSLAKVVDNAGQGGTAAGEAVLPATLNAGIAYPIPYTFRQGVTYQVSVWLKSMSGSLQVRPGIGSLGTPADAANVVTNLTAATWVQKTLTWTPTADRTDAVLYVRVVVASAATVRVDAIQLNPGAALNAYIEAPTKGELTSGRPVHMYATYNAVQYARFFGYTRRIVPDPESETVEVVVDDVLTRLANTSVIVPQFGFQPTARALRMAILEDFERGNLNLLPNPSFETNTAGWGTGAGVTITRTTTDAAPGGGTAYGSMVTTGASQVLTANASYVPAYFNDEVYRASIYVKVAAGTATGKLRFGNSSAFIEKAFTATTTWQRVTVALRVAGALSMSVDPLRMSIFLDAAGTLRLDNAMITRGPALTPYAHVGSGRYPNFVGNGGFEAGSGSLTGWYAMYRNLITNPSFETDTSGWSVAADAFHAGGATITRVTTGAHKFGSAHAEIAVTASTTVGAHFAITGTFLSGVAYQWLVWVNSNNAGGIGIKVGVGSQGTPADFSQVTAVPTNTGYIVVSGTWTPSANRSDAHFYVAGNNGVNAGNVLVDGAFIARAASGVAYSNTGPGGGGSEASNVYLVVGNSVIYGGVAMGFDTPATASVGRMYDLNDRGALFVGGQTYAWQISVRPTSNMPYKAGISVLDTTTGNFTESTPATGTATANTWTTISGTWTPATDVPTQTAFRNFVYIMQTDATARTVWVDALRIVPGNAIDAVELPQWSVPATAERDLLVSTVTASGSALSALASLNALTLSRHWIRPTMSAPWYQYVVEDRATFAAKSVAQTYTEVIDEFTRLDVDDDQIINTVEIVVFSASSYWYSDPVSVDRFGPKSIVMDVQSLTNSSALADAVGPALIFRYGLPRLRPQMVASQQFDALLGTDLNSVIRAIMARHLVDGAFVVIREDVSIEQGGRRWVATYQLEEYPY